MGNGPSWGYHMAQGIVIPMQTTDAGREQVRQNLDNLGSQMSQLVQSYNEQRTKIEGEPGSPEFKAQMHTLWEARRAAIAALVAQFKTAAQSAAQQNITANTSVPALAGLRGDDLGGLQTAVATEQSKLAALATYYESAKAAIAAGQPMPPTPAELQTGTVMGISSTWLAIGAVAVLLFFMGKK